MAQYYRIRESEDLEDENASSLSLYDSRETRHYGSFYSELHITQYSEGLGSYYLNSGEEEDEDDLHGAFTIRQNDFQLSENMTMDNILGVHRPYLGMQRYYSSRLVLPTPSLAGATSSIRSGKHQLFASIGELGELRGPLSQAFFTRGAQTALVGDSWQLPHNWQLTGDVWNVSEAIYEEDNRTGYSLVTVRHNELTRQPDMFLQWVGNQDHGQGLSGYMKKRFSRFRHELGAYANESDINWLTYDLPDKQQGIYLRSDYDKNRTNLSGTLEYIDSEIDFYSEPTTREGWLANLGWQFRQSYASTYTANGFYRGYHQGNGLERYFASSYNARLNYSRQHSRRLSSRWEAFQAESDLSNDGNAVTTQSLEYALRFNATNSRQLELELGVERRYDDYVETWNPKVDISGNMPLPKSGWLDGSIGYSLYDSDDINQQADWHARLHAEFPFSSQWIAGVQLNHNQAYYDFTDTSFSDNAFDIPDSRYASSALLTLRYRTGGGSALRPLGNAGGRRGSGSIIGMIFLDENNDGIRQSQEAAAAGIEVFLDGRFIARTGANGEFQYPLVTIGPHRLFIAEETLPLPWEAAENNLGLTVSLRQTTRVSLPLQRIR